MWRVQAFDREGREVAALEAQNGEVTIGRENDRRLVLPSPSVSRRHARVVLDGPQPFIEDQGSANGVIVNGVKISGPTALVPGVRVDIAEFRLEFSVPPATQAVSPISDGRFVQRPPALETAPLRLIAEEGPFAGQVFEIRPGPLTVGRAIDNDLVFDDPSLSRKHARVRHNGDFIELEDLGSSNGTFVNGRKIDTATARPGDVVRFGELVFRLEGDQPPQASQELFVPAKKGVPPIALYAGAGVLVVIIGVLISVILFRHKAPSGGDEMDKLAQQSAAHMKAGKDKLDAKDFVGAGKEFEQVLAIDPTNSDARKLQKVALSEPQNEQASKQTKVKIAMASSRADFEGAIKQYGQVPADSVYHEPTAEKLASKLVSFGEAQCKAKKFADCAWAICRASEVAPAQGRATLVPVAADAALRDAEKKLARDKTYVPCKKR